MAVRLFPLPSSAEPTWDRQLNMPSVKKLPFSIADLTMDPTQDLIVVSEFRSAVS